MIRNRVSATRLLVLTDFNVSNVHHMLAEELHSEPSLQVRYVDCGPRKQRENDWRWFAGGRDPASPRSRAGAGLSMAVRCVQAWLATIRSDVVFTSGWIGFLPRLMRKSYIYWSYGSDLDQYAFRGASAFARSYGLTLATRIKRHILRILYLKAIQGASVTIVAPYQKSNVTKIGYRRLGFIPHSLEPAYSSFNIETKPGYVYRLHEAYAAHWILFSGTRHVWNRQLWGQADYKGNDVMLRGLAAFSSANAHSVPAWKLLLIDRGADAEASRRLAVELGISDHIVWLSEVPRRKLLPLYAGADVCFDQFSLGCLALTAIEALACGTPVISYIGNDQTGVPFYNSAPPILNVNSAAEIATALQNLFTNEAYARSLQKASHEWVRRECSPECRREALVSLVDVARGSVERPKSPAS